jgi:hypothetical protein
LSTAFCFNSDDLSEHKSEKSKKGIKPFHAKRNPCEPAAHWEVVAPLFKEWLKKKAL